jgi:Protein of unknown function (DUF998)
MIIGDLIALGYCAHRAPRKRGKFLNTTSASMVWTTPRRYPRAYWLALAGAVGPLLFVFATATCDVIQHSWLIQHNFDPATQAPVSDNALGPYGIVQTAGFIAIGIGIMSLAQALHLQLPTGRRRDVAGIAFLALTGLALFASAATEDDPHSALATAGHYTWHGWIHNISFFVMVFSQVAAYAFLWRRMRQDPSWSGHAKFTLVWAIAVLPALGASFAIGGGLHISAFYVWLLLFPVGWPVLTALRALRLQCIDAWAEPAPA